MVKGQTAEIASFSNCNEKMSNVTMSVVTPCVGKLSPKRGQLALEQRVDKHLFTTEMSPEVRLSTQFSSTSKIPSTLGSSNLGIEASWSTEKGSIPFLAQATSGSGPACMVKSQQKDTMQRVKLVHVAQATSGWRPACMVKSQRSHRFLGASNLRVEASLHVLHGQIPCLGDIIYPSTWGWRWAAVAVLLINFQSNIAWSTGDGEILATQFITPVVHSRD